MCGGSQPTGQKTCSQHQADYAELIRNQMARQGVSLRRLVEEGIIKRSHRSGLFERIADGSLSIGGFNRINERLGIDPVRAALAVRCFAGPSAYDDACCETSAHVATALAQQLPAEMAACEGIFEPIRENLVKGLAQRTTLAIVRYHVSLEARRDDPSHFDRTFG